MAIEIIPQPKFKIPLWSVIVSVLCLVLLLGLIGSYFYFNINSQKLSQKIEEKDKILEKTVQEKELEEEIIFQEQRINHYKTLASEHRKILNVFDFLEKVTHPQIWLLEFNLIPSKELLNLKGQAATFTALGQQILILEKEPIFKKVNLSEVSLGEEGEIEFSLQLTLDPRVFK